MLAECFSRWRVSRCFASKVGDRAPKARDTKARGKRGAKRNASPLVAARGRQGLKGRNNNGITPFQGSKGLTLLPRGDAFRFAPHLPLAFAFRAFGAGGRDF